jgi:hypothetical protein
MDVTELQEKNKTYDAKQAKAHLINVIYPRACAHRTVQAVTCHHSISDVVMHDGCFQGNI